MVATARGGATRSGPDLGSCILHAGDLPGTVRAEFDRVERVAWDIETTGLDWRTDRIATCQLYADEIGTHIVRLGNGIPAQMQAMLENERLVKLFHHALFDLRFMAAAWRCKPVAIRCTKVASKILDPGREKHSLQVLVRDYLGIEMDKAARMSNWLASTLSSEQLQYAAKDVQVLPALFEVLSSKLLEDGRWPTARKCFEFLPSKLQLDLWGCERVFEY